MTTTRSIVLGGRRAVQVDPTEVERGCWVSWWSDTGGSQWGWVQEAHHGRKHQWVRVAPHRVRIGRTTHQLRPARRVQLRDVVSAWRPTTPLVHPPCHQLGAKR